jgi:hypothetical protein
MQIPTGVIGIITLLAGIFLTNRFKIRWPILACLCLPCIAGAAGLIRVSRSNLRGLMATYYITWFLAGIRESKVPAGSHRKVSHKCIEPLLFAWANLNAAGTTKRVVTTAAMFGGSCIGNVSFLGSRRPVTSLTIPDCGSAVVLFLGSAHLPHWSLL